MLYIFRKLPSSWFLSSNGHVTLRLTVFEIFAVKWPNLGQRFRIWGSLGTPPPKGKRTCPGVIFTIMQNCTLIGDTVAEIFVTGQSGQRQSKPSTLPYSRMAGNKYQPATTTTTYNDNDDDNNRSNDDNCYDNCSYDNNCQIRVSRRRCIYKHHSTQSNPQLRIDNWIMVSINDKSQQEAQFSRRNRAMLRVIEYFAELLKKCL